MPSNGLANAELARRISIIRIVMIAGIVALHVPPYVPMQDIGPGAFDLFKAYIQNAVFRTSVPTLTFVSGYLLFSSGLDENFRELIRKKVRTLLAPLLIFNAALLPFIFAAQYFGLVQSDFSVALYPIEAWNWVNAVFALNDTPANYPLVFLRDLFVVSLMAPAFGFAIRRKPYLGLAATFTVFWFNLDGTLVLRNDMPIVFYAGGLVALRLADHTLLDKFAWPLLAIFLALCGGYIMFRIEDRDFLRIVSPMMLWPAASLLVPTRIGSWLSRQARHSFFIFLCHGPVLAALWLIHQRFPHLMPPYPVWWMLVLVLTLLGLSLLHDAIVRRYPAALGIMLGGRL